MKFDSKIHHRRSIRLQGYDYSQPGMYFVTIVTHGRESLFGEIENGEMCLNRYGRIVLNAWFDLPRHYPYVELGTFCIMPNHIHGIIILTDDRRGGSRMAEDSSQAILSDESGHLANDPQTRPYYNKRHALPEIVRALKSFSAIRINAARGTEGVRVWQRNYYEHIIRNDDEHNRIHLYVEANVDNWGADEENPGRRGGSKCRTAV